MNPPPAGGKADGIAGAVAGAVAIALIALAIGWALGVHRMLRIALYTEQFLAVALALALALTFLTNRLRALPFLDWLLVGFALVGGIWLAVAYPSLSIEAAIDPAVGLPAAVPLLIALI